MSTSGKFDELKETLSQKTMKELRIKADESGIPLPKKFTKDDAVDYLAERILAIVESSSEPEEQEEPQPEDEQPAAEPEQAEASEAEQEKQDDVKPPHLVRHEEIVLENEKMVAAAAIEMAQAQARAKAAKRRFDELTEYLIELINHKPEPTLFDNEPDDGELSKQAKEALELCPSCMGKGCDGEGVECTTCGGDGKAKPGEEFATQPGNEDFLEDENPECGEENETETDDEANLQPAGFAEPDECEQV